MQISQLFSTNTELIGKVCDRKDHFLEDTKPEKTQDDERAGSPDSGAFRRRENTEIQPADD